MVMLSYQHAYHAGNHADILKHFVLQFVLNSLNKKEKPYTFFDTHSGSGLYDLIDNRSLKTGEAKSGIQTLFSKADIIPELESYTNLVRPYMEKNLYPGSPEIERSMMRAGDHLILSELHPQEVKNLNHNMKEPVINGPAKASVQVHNRNGWEMLKALTPPATKRGAALIDPSYEEASDYSDAADTICQVHKKWSNGIIMLWYPLLAHREAEIENMVERISESARVLNANIEISDLRLEVFDKNAHVETSLEEVLSDDGKKNPPRLYGSGMLVLNSPWHLQETAEAAISYLKSVISHQSQGEC